MSFFDKLRSLKAKLFRRIGFYELKFRAQANLRYTFRAVALQKHYLPGKLVVSLTSFPPRFAVLHLTLKTLLSQSMPPDLTILWIYEGDADKLTSKVRSLVGPKFEIRTVEKDIRSYKKLMPAIDAFPEAYIVTADDDTYYEANWLRDLVRSHRIGQKEVLGHRGHLLSLEADGKISPYDTWEWDTKDEKIGPRIFLTGVGGILYPPGSLTSEDDIPDVYMKICPNDDIWFYFMAHKNGFLSRKITGDFSGYTWGQTQEVALFHSNVAGGANDRAMQAMILKYGSPL